MEDCLMAHPWHDLNCGTHINQHRPCIQHAAHSTLVSSLNTRLCQCLPEFSAHACRWWPPLHMHWLNTLHGQCVCEKIKTNVGYLWHGVKELLLPGHCCAPPDFALFSRDTASAFWRSLLLHSVSCTFCALSAAYDLSGGTRCQGIIGEDERASRLKCCLLGRTSLGILFGTTQRDYAGERTPGLGGSGSGLCDGRGEFAGWVRVRSIAQHNVEQDDSGFWIACFLG